MGILLLISVLLAPSILYHTLPTTASRIKIVNNGYDGILVSLPPEADADDRAQIVSSMKDLFDESSPILSQATKGRAHFHSVTFLVPQTWGEMDHWLPSNDGISFDDAGAANRRQDADVVVSHSTTNDHPYTLHQGGCGRRALRIYLPSRFLLTGEKREKGVEFVRLWSEFRYGVFPEGGFDDDTKYPTSYQSPEDTSNRTTGCNSEPLRTLSHCEEQDECIDNPVKSSLMDQHQPISAVHFCENYLNLGPRHDPNAPSKHNLLCNEEGTWFTVLRNPDFKQGRNAAPKNISVTKVIFRYVRELVAPRVLVAIDISSHMNRENRYDLTKNAFSQFVTSFLPDGTELSVLVFGGDSEPNLVTSSVKLVDKNTKTSYLESLPLPDEPHTGDNVCIDCVLESIVELVTNENRTFFSSSPIIILVTAEYFLNEIKLDNVLQKLQSTEVVLNVMTFAQKYDIASLSQASLYDLCSKTGHNFIHLEGDPFRNLYNGFHEAVVGSRTNVLVYQEYLTTLDEENIQVSFVLDKSLSQALEVLISGPLFETTSILEYDKTILVGPDGSELRPKKHELIPSLNFYILNPKTGMYVLKTRRKKLATSPVLVSVFATPVPVEDSISLKIWSEVTEYKISPQPVEIFAEVRKGPYPVQNVSAVAHVRHPNGYLESFSLFDDGLGSVDVTHGDGIYSHYFTNFSGIGFYNVKVKVSGGFEDYSRVLKGPTSYCCGSSFSSSEEVSTGQFQRETGVATFRVTTAPDGVDQYPPARVTDLRVAKAFNHIIALQWSAVGSDFDTGEAAAYELKLFRDRSLIQHRFSESGLKLETIEINSPAAYGTNLYHVLQIPSLLEEGVYYFGIRALDDSDNAGEPSNAVALWLRVKNGTTVIDCTDEPTAEKINSASINSPIAPIVVYVIFLTICNIFCV